MAEELQAIATVPGSTATCVFKETFLWEVQIAKGNFFYRLHKTSFTYHLIIKL